MMRRYVVIGSGAAGITAIDVIRRQDPQGDIILVAEDRYGYYSRPGLAYLLSKEIPETMLFPFSDQDFTSLRVKRVAAQATHILPDTHQVRLINGATLQYDRLLLATGSQAIRLQIPGADLDGSVKLDNIDDARKIIKLAGRGKTAVVVGGGITALEIVEGLAARCVKVHYFLRDNRYWGNVLEESESRVIEDRLREEGVIIHYYTEMVEILGKKGKVTGVRTKKDEILRCDIVAVAIGVRPRIELANTCELETDRGILVDEYMQTNQPDIYAAGDIGQVRDPRTGKTTMDTLWGSAKIQGKFAGLNISGTTMAFSKPVAFNVTRLAGLTTTIIGAVGSGGRDPDLLGIARGDSESWREPNNAGDKKFISTQSEFDVNRLRLIIGESKLVGALLIGDQTLSSPLQQLVALEADITPIRARLLMPEQPLPDIIGKFFKQWQGQHAVYSDSQKAS
jgi:NADPH-dependent 2,4-dienoyl-CoA reductase/sulfur reductase-like enzyme